jgi:hypothetical protein
MSRQLAQAPQAADLYDRDFYEWTVTQGKALREQRPVGLDWENLAEEIESLGRSDKREIRSRLIVLLLHLLKWQFQPTKRKPGWRASIIEARDQLSEQLLASPSLRIYPAQILAKQYEIACLKAADETGLDMGAFPQACPYTLPDILDETFYPGEPA